MWMVGIGCGEDLEKVLGHCIFCDNTGRGNDLNFASYERERSLWVFPWEVGRFGGNFG